MLVECDCDLDSQESTVSHTHCSPLSPAVMNTNSMGQNGNEPLNKTSVADEGTDQTQNKKEDLEMAECACRPAECETRLTNAPSGTEQSVEHGKRTEVGQQLQDREPDFTNKSSLGTNSVDSSLGNAASSQEVDSDSDLSDEKIISLSEEDLSAGEMSSDLVITNVCSAEDDMGSAVQDKSGDVAGFSSPALDSIELLASSNDSYGSTNNTTPCMRTICFDDVSQSPPSSGVCRFKQNVLKQTDSHSEEGVKKLPLLGNSFEMVPGAVGAQQESPASPDVSIFTGKDTITDSNLTESPVTSSHTKPAEGLQSVSSLFSTRSLPQRKALEGEPCIQNESSKPPSSMDVSGAGPFAGNRIERRLATSVASFLATGEQAAGLECGKGEENDAISSGLTQPFVSNSSSSLLLLKRKISERRSQENGHHDTDGYMGKKRKLENSSSQKSSQQCCKRNNTNDMSDVTNQGKKEKSDDLDNSSSSPVSQFSVTSCGSKNYAKQQTERQNMSKPLLCKKPQTASNKQLLPLVPKITPLVGRSEASSSLKLSQAKVSHAVSERGKGATVGGVTNLPTTLVSSMLKSAPPLGTNNSTSNLFSLTSQLFQSEDFKKLIQSNRLNIPQTVQLPLPDGKSRTITVLVSPIGQTATPKSTASVTGRPVPSLVTSTTASSVTGNVTLSQSVPGSVPGAVLLTSVPITAFVSTHTNPDTAKSCGSQVIASASVDTASSASSVTHLKGATATSSKAATRKPQGRILLPKTPAKAGSKQNDIDTEMTVEDIGKLLQHTNPVEVYKPPMITELQTSQMHCCLECGDTFATASGHSSHMNRMSIVIRYACHSCSQALAFFNKCAFMSHLRLHADAGQGEGDGGGRSLRSHPLSVSSLPDHLLRPAGPQVFVAAVDSLSTPIDCPECGLPLANADLLSVHFGTAAKQCNFLHTCQFCDMDLPSACALKAHLRLHTNSRMVHARPPYICPECGLPFLTQTSLYQHLLSACLHFSRLVSIKCNMCGAIFSSRYSMRCHLLQQHIDEAGHEDERMSADYTFACNLCSGVRCFFPTKDALHKHLSSLQNSYRYKCISCSAGFILLSELCQHIDWRHASHCISSDQGEVNAKIKPDVCLPLNMWQVLRQTSIEVTARKLLDIRFSTEEESKSPRSKQVDAFFCPFCGFVPSSTASIKKHLNDHQVWDQMVCQICWRGHFFTEKDYQYHCELHANKTTSGLKLKNGSCQVDFLTAKTAMASSGPVTKSLPSSKPGLGPYQSTVLSPCTSSKSSSLCDDESSSNDDLDDNDEGGGEAAANFLKFPPFLMDSESENQPASQPFHSCHLCGLTYRSEEMLRNHYSHVHIGHKNVFACLVCRKRKKERAFHKKELLVNHCIRKHRLSALEAENMVSKESIRPRVLMPGELSPVPGHQPESCVPGPSTSSRETSPVKRLRVVGDARQDFVCAKCSFSTDIMVEFRSHIAIHKVESCVQCLECGQSFSVLASLKKHLFMVHHILQPDTYIEENHIKMTEPSEEISTHLDLFQSFHNKNLQVAEMFHEALNRPQVVTELRMRENPLECTVCYREFENEGQLKMHMRNHGMAFIRSRRTRLKEEYANDKGGDMPIDSNTLTKNVADS